MKMRKNKKGLFILELFLAIIISVVCSLIGMSNLLLESNELYPAATNFMGHMTKVAYISEQLMQGHIPSWFPYWYNGSTVTQYYVPLSYYLMVPIYWVTNNIMLTFKIYWAVLFTIGGLGIWAFCYRKIGRGCGLIGIVAFCLNPVLLKSAYWLGVIAQAPIFAIMPWLLLLMLSLAQKPSRPKYFGTTVLITLMILSHAMHAFMVCLNIAVVIFICVVLRKVKLRNFFIACSSIAFSGILTAFWSVVGSTQLETPGTPYLLPDSVAEITANIYWFIPGGDTYFYFPIEISTLCIIGLACHIINTLLKKKNESHEYYGLACIFLTVISAIFSFGLNLPGFKYLPFASDMVPGRILTLTSVSGAIVSAYAIYMLWNYRKMKWLFRPATLGLVIYLGYLLNPFTMVYPADDLSIYITRKDMIENKASAFDKGRYQAHDSIRSDELYFMLLNDYNVCTGWNIEGTPHNRKLYNDNLALPLSKNDYILKEIAFWNIRYIHIPDTFQSLIERIENELGFKLSEGEWRKIYISDYPSSYYLTDSRNALVISDELQGFSIHFPYFIQGWSSNLMDYTEEELLRYKLIYIIEPNIKTLSEKNEFETMVSNLVNKGVVVMIEPKQNYIFDLFGVTTNEEVYGDTVNLSPALDDPYGLPYTYIENNNYLTRIRALYFLDEVYASIRVPNSNVEMDIIGAKNIGNGKVIFIGGHLSQYLDAVYARNLGLASYSDMIKENSDRVEEMYKSIFTYYGINMDYMPEIFDSVTEHHWDYNGGSFTYESDMQQDVIVSVTYTPRWTATVDGKEIPVGQMEHLITLTLPAGRHTVELKYGITVYGLVGYIISAVGVVLFLVLMLAWNGIVRLYDRMSFALGDYLQIYDAPADKYNEGMFKEFVSEMSAAVSEIMDEILPDEEAEETAREEADEVKTEEEKTDESNFEVYKTEDDISIKHRTVETDDIKIDIIVID